LKNWETSEREQTECLTGGMLSFVSVMMMVRLMGYERSIMMMMFIVRCHEEKTTILIIIMG
jgi:hypothetical protein